MAKHRNPHRVNDPKDIFDVCENSSHPELFERRRIYDFKGRIFQTLTDLEKFMENEGYDPMHFWILPKWERDGDGSLVNRVHIIERAPQDEMHLVKDFKELYA